MGILKFVVRRTVGRIVIGGEVGFALGQGGMRGRFVGFGDGQPRVRRTVVGGGRGAGRGGVRAGRGVVLAVGRRRAQALVLGARAAARREAVQQRPRYTSLPLQNKKNMLKQCRTKSVRVMKKGFSLRINNN